MKNTIITLALTAALSTLGVTSAYAQQVSPSIYAASPWYVTLQAGAAKYAKNTFDFDIWDNTSSFDSEGGYGLRAAVGYNLSAYDNLALELGLSKMHNTNRVVTSGSSTSKAEMSNMMEVDLLAKYTFFKGDSVNFYGKLGPSLVRYDLAAPTAGLYDFTSATSVSKLTAKVGFGAEYAFNSSNDIDFSFNYTFGNGDDLKNKDYIPSISFVAIGLHHHF